MKKILNRVVAIFLIILVFINAFSKVMAITVAQTGSSLDYLKDGNGAALMFAIKQASDGRYAYCIEHKKATPSGQNFEKGSPIDNGLTYILKNGYPNVSFTGDWKKDYYITQSAVHYYLGEVQWIVNAKGEQIIKDSIFDLVDRARNADINEYTVVNSIAIVPKHQSFYQSGDYLITDKFKVTKSGDLKDYEVILIGAPENTEVVEKSESGFSLRVHKENIKDVQYNISISINAYFGEENANIYYTTSSTYQKVAILDIDTIVREVSDLGTASLEAYSELKLVKRDAETKELIDGTVFNITSNLGYDETVIVNGELHLTKLLPATYTIKEVSANPNYVLDTITRDVSLNLLDVSEIIIENRHKKGRVDIVKYDKDDKNHKLEGVEFEIRDNSNKLIEQLITDKNGYAISSELNIGEYTLIETKTLKDFRIAEDRTINIKYNNILNLEIENEKCKGFIKVIKVDENNKEIKLEGVKFLVLDDRGNIVEYLKTDGNGEVVSKELPVGSYIIKEISAKSGYSLSPNNPTVIVREKETTEIEICNKKLPRTGY